MWIILICVAPFFFAIGYLIDNRKEITKELRQVQRNARRYIYAARAAHAAWLAWEDPAIVNLREALEMTAAIDQRAMERALFEVADQKSNGKVSADA